MELKALAEGLKFEQALFWMKGGFRVKRASWPQNAYIRISEYAPGRQGIVATVVSPGLTSNSIMALGAEELLAEDWQLVI